MNGYLDTLVGGLFNTLPSVHSRPVSRFESPSADAGWSPAPEAAAAPPGGEAPAVSPSVRHDAPASPPAPVPTSGAGGLADPGETPAEPSAEPASPEALAPPAKNLPPAPFAAPAPESGALSPAAANPKTGFPEPGADPGPQRGSVLRRDARVEEGDPAAVPPVHHNPPPTPALAPPEPGAASGAEASFTIGPATHQDVPALARPVSQPPPAEPAAKGGEARPPAIRTGNAVASRPGIEPVTAASPEPFAALVAPPALLVVPVAGDVAGGNVPPSPPAVEVTIGRIEVRAERSVSPTPTPAAPSPAAPALRSASSLDDYLARRRGGS